MVVQRSSMQLSLPEARQPWGGPRERLMVKCPLWRLAFSAWRLEEAGKEYTGGKQGSFRVRFTKNSKFLIL